MKFPGLGPLRCATDYALMPDLMEAEQAQTAAGNRGIESMGEIVRQSSGTWQECAHDGCRAEALPDEGRCLKHVQSERRSEVLQGIQNGGRVPPFNGLQIDDDLFGQLIASFPLQEDGRRHLPAVSFRSAEFHGIANFSGMLIDAGDFTEATFNNFAMFGGTIFSNLTVFNHATFKMSAQFADANFAGGIGGTATYDDVADFDFVASRRLCDRYRSVQRTDGLQMLPPALAECFVALHAPRPLRCS